MTVLWRMTDQISFGFCCNSGLRRRGLAVQRRRSSRCEWSGCCAKWSSSESAVQTLRTSVWISCRNWFLWLTTLRVVWICWGSGADRDGCSWPEFCDLSERSVGSFGRSSRTQKDQSFLIGCRQSISFGTWDLENVSIHRNTNSRSMSALSPVWKTLSKTWSHSGMYWDEWRLSSERDRRYLCRSSLSSAHTVGKGWTRICMGGRNRWPDNDHWTTRRRRRPNWWQAMTVIEWLKWRQNDIRDENELNIESSEVSNGSHFGLKSTAFGGQPQAISWVEHSIRAVIANWNELRNRTIFEWKMSNHCWYRSQLIWIDCEP